MIYIYILKYFQEKKKRFIKIYYYNNLKNIIFIIINSTNFDEYESSTSIRDKSNIFNNLIPYPDQGKIFIGFPTQQVILIIR